MESELPIMTPSKSVKFTNKDNIRFINSRKTDNKENDILNSNSKKNINNNSKSPNRNQPLSHLTPNSKKKHMKDFVKSSLALNDNNNLLNQLNSAITTTPKKKPVVEKGVVHDMFDGPVTKEEKKHARKYTKRKTIFISNANEIEKVKDQVNKNFASTCISSNFKSFIARKKFAQVKESIIKIQSVVRMFLAKRRYLVQLESIRLEKERLEMERLEKEKLEMERIEKEKLEMERLEKEKLEMERLEQERLEKERLEKKRLEKERIEQERLEIERLEKERLEKEKIEEMKRIEKRRLEKEKLEIERMEKERLERERLLIMKKQLEKERHQEDYSLMFVGQDSMINDDNIFDDQEDDDQDEDDQERQDQENFLNLGDLSSQKIENEEDIEDQGVQKDIKKPSSFKQQTDDFKDSFESSLAPNALLLGDEEDGEEQDKDKPKKDIASKFGSTHKLNESKIGLSKTLRSSVAKKPAVPSRLSVAVKKPAASRLSTAPSRTSIAPSRTSIAPSRTSVAPSRASVAPSRTSVAPSRTSVAPKTARVSTAPRTSRVSTVPSKADLDSRWSNKFASLNTTTTNNDSSVLGNSTTGTSRKRPTLTSFDQSKVQKTTSSDVASTSSVSKSTTITVNRETIQDKKKKLEELKAKKAQFNSTLITKPSILSSSSSLIGTRVLSTTGPSAPSTRTLRTSTLPPIPKPTPRPVTTTTTTTTTTTSSSLSSRPAFSTSSKVPIPKPSSLTAKKL